MPNPYDRRTVKENNFEAVPDGKYKVIGIEDFFTLDSRELPVFVPQGGDVVVRGHLKLSPAELKKLADEGKQVTQGPAFSANRNQLMLILRALGGNVNRLPEGETTAFLLEVQTRANNAGVEQTAQVTGGEGWAKYISGTNPEENVGYIWEFVNATTHDKTEPLRFQPVSFPGKKGGNYTQEIVYFWFRLAGDMWGKPTPYDGYQFRMIVANPFSGEVRKVDDDRWQAFVRLYLPEGFENRDWQEDPEKSEFGINELDNPIIVYVNAAKKANRKAFSQFKLNDKGFAKMDIQDFVSFSPPIDLDSRKAEESSQPWQLAELVELLDEVVEEQTNVKAFEPTAKDSNVINLTWTGPGLDWAKTNLAKLWDEAKLPLVDGKRVLGNLTGGEAASLELVVRKAYNKVKAPKNAALTDEGSF